MLTNETNYNSIINSGKLYTISEAVDLMKTLNPFNDINKQLNWKSAKTGKPTYIGYNPCYEKTNKKEVIFKSKFIPQTKKSPKYFI